MSALFHSLPARLPLLMFLEGNHCVLANATCRHVDMDIQSYRVSKYIGRRLSKVEPIKVDQLMAKYGADSCLKLKISQPQMGFLFFPSLMNVECQPWPCCVKPCTDECASSRLMWRVLHFDSDESYPPSPHLPSP